MVEGRDAWAPGLKIKETEWIDELSNPPLQLAVLGQFAVGIAERFTHGSLSLVEFVITGNLWNPLHAHRAELA